MTDPDRRIRRLVREIRLAHAPDPRADVFQSKVRTLFGTTVVHLETTLPNAALELVGRLESNGLDADVRLTLLPDPTLQPRGEALVSAPLAGVHARPTMRSTLLTQYAMGSRLTLLNRDRSFWRVRGEDGHIGWVHEGFLIRGELEWALAWERAEGGEPVVSLGAVLNDEADRPFACLPWGARVIQQAGGKVLLPDGRTGRLGEGELVDADRLWDRFPPRGESVTRTARRWLGAPYVWGGVTPHGVDCSGLIQSVYWIHGVALPRDADQQQRVGYEIEIGPEWEDLRPGDVLYFATGETVDHVALSLGGQHIIHAAAGNGGVDVNDLSGERELEKRLLSQFAGARRLFPDGP